MAKVSRSSYDRKLQKAWEIGYRQGKAAGEHERGRETEAVAAGRRPWSKQRWGDKLYEDKDAFDRTGTAEELPSKSQRDWDRLSHYRDQVYRPKDPSAWHRIWWAFEDGWDRGFSEGAQLWWRLEGKSEAF